MRIVILSVAVALVVAACGGVDGGATETSAPTTTTTSVAPTTSPTPSSIPGETVPPTDPPITGEAPDAVLDPILADAAERTGVAVDDLVVVRDQFVEWPDGSLGCPEPGMVYTQVITPGYWVVVDADGTSLDYRTDAEGRFKLCERPGRGFPVVPTTTGDAPDA
ncbi:MAG: hypothetical protein AB1Z57_10605 [Acidimicrobiia bacterium]